MMSQEGELVIIYSEEHPELQWKRGIILELHKSDEGQVRKSQSQNKNYRNCQSQKQFYPLEAKVEEAIENHYRNNKINTFEFEGFTQDDQIKNKDRVKTLMKSMTTSVSNKEKTLAQQNKVKV